MIATHSPSLDSRMMTGLSLGCGRETVRGWECVFGGHLVGVIVRRWVLQEPGGWSPRVQWSDVGRHRSSKDTEPASVGMNGVREWVRTQVTSRREPPDCSGRDGACVWQSAFIYRSFLQGPNNLFSRSSVSTFLRQREWASCWVSSWILVLFLLKTINKSFYIPCLHGCGFI